VSATRTVWVAPAAWSALTHARAQHMAQAGLDVVAAPGLDEAIGPAVLLLAPADLQGTRRAAHLALARAALPGNPVLLGGTDERDTLLDAVNNWKVWRVVPREAPPEELSDALLSASELLGTRRALHQGVETLYIETRRIQDAIARLSQARDRLVEGERQAAGARVSGGLLRCVDQHMQTFEEFEAAIAGMPGDPVLERQAYFVFEGLRAMVSLLGDLGSADAAAGAPLERQPLDRTVENVLMYCRFDRRTNWRRLGASLHCGVEVPIDRHRLFHAVSSLLRHVLEHTPDGVAVLLETSATDTEAHVVIREEDARLESAAISRLRVDAERDPVSPGLRVCLQVVERQRGRVEVARIGGRSALFRLCLPRTTGVEHR
jgi:hypothetical protein